MNFEINKAVTGIWACPRPHGKYQWIYPEGILDRLQALIGDFNGKKVLHLFSGSSEMGVGIDINPAVKPDHVLDLSKNAIPYLDDDFDVVLADPPYENFKPYCFVDEAVRVLKPDGFFCVLHFLIYKTPASCRRYACIGVTSGPNMRMRALNIFRKKREGATVTSDD